MKRILPVIVLSLIILLSACHANVPDETDKPTKPTTITSPTNIVDTQPTTPHPTAPPTTDPTAPPTTDPTPTDPPVTDPQPSIPSTTDPPPTEPDPNALTAEEIVELQKLYEMPSYPDHRTIVAFYNIALGQTYSDPREIDLYRFFCSGDFTEWSITDSEDAFIKSAIRDSEYMDVFRATPENMDHILQMCFGLSLKDMQGNGLDSFAYFEETGCYYNATTSPPSCADFLEITGGSHMEDGNLKVFYTAYHKKQQYVMILKPVDDGYHILSNLEAE